MSQFFDEDEDLLSEDYKKKDDGLDDDLDEERLLYGSDDDEVELLNEVSPEISDVVPQQDNESTIASSVDPLEDETAALDNNVQQESVKRAATVLNDSDSEGTDTKDENDDGPIDNDDVARKKIKIYRTISDASNSNANTFQEQNNPEDDQSYLANSSGIQEGPGDIADEDEDSDDEERDKRDRFRSERDGTQVSTTTLRTNASEKRVIPDTLEISEEERQKLENFDKEERERRFNRRFKGRGRGKWRGNGRSQPRFHQIQMQRGPQPRPLLSQGQTHPLLNIPLFPPLLQNANLSRPPPMFLNQPPSNAGGFPHFLMQRPPRDMSVPPPGWRPPVTLPPQLAVSTSMPPPHLPTIPSHMLQPGLAAVSSLQQPVSTIPVIAASNRNKDEGSSDSVAKNTSTSQAQGNPIPTVLSGGQRANLASQSLKTAEDSQTGREVVFDKMERSSPQLSVKITRSRSRSPVARSNNSKRTVIRPRRSRSPPSSRSRRSAKSPTSKKRSRRRSRSYSPRRRSLSPRRNQASDSSGPAPRSGKILINPHFKGARAIPTSTNLPKTIVTNSQTPATASLPIFSNMPPPIISVPPPPILSQPLGLPPKILVPPPAIPRPNTAIPPPAVRPPISIPPPGMLSGILPPPNISVPPPRLPGNPPPRVDAEQRPPGRLLPPGTIARPSLASVPRTNSAPQPIGPPPPHVVMPQRPNIMGAPRPGGQPGKPVVHIRPVFDTNQGPTIRPAFGNDGLLPTPVSSGLTQDQLMLLSNPQGQNLATSRVLPASRLKPPPAVGSDGSQSKHQVWEGPPVDDKYQSLMRKQAEKRKELLARKAQRRNYGKGTDGVPIGMKTATIQKVVPSQSHPTYTPYKPSSCTVKVTNLAAATKLESVAKLMTSVGPLDNVNHVKHTNAVVGVFKSAQHAKAFTDKFNRHMLDLSYITATLEG